MALSFPTFSDLVQDVILELSQVPGTSVQAYSEDIIGRYVQSAFNDVFDLYFWPNYSKWVTYTLDGTVGIPNADIDSDVRRIQDIAVMFRGGTNTKVQRLTATENPTLITGTTAQFYTSYPTSLSRIFRVYPAASTGTLNLYVRTKPVDFTSSESIYLDPDCVILKAAWFYSTQDSANLEQAALFKKRHDDRVSLVLGDIIKSAPVPINPSAGAGVPTEWT